MNPYAKTDAHAAYFATRSAFFFLCATPPPALCSLLQILSFMHKSANFRISWCGEHYSHLLIFCKVELDSRRRSAVQSRRKQAKKKSRRKLKEKTCSEFIRNMR